MVFYNATDQFDNLGTCRFPVTDDGRGYEIVFFFTPFKKSFWEHLFS